MPSLTPQVQHVNEANGDGLARLHRAQHGVRDANLLQMCQEFGGNLAAAEDLPVDVSSGKEDLVVHLRAGQVGDEHAEGNRQQQQGLELLHNRQVQQTEGNDHHDQNLPVPRGDLIEAGRLNKIHDSFHLVFLPVAGLSRSRTAASRTPQRRPW